MPVPWLQLIDAALGVANFARGRKSQAQDEPSQQLQAGAQAPGGLEARLASVVVAALKEAFDRDSRRLELEREQLAAERSRAERAMRLELRRQAADHEIGRLRLLGGVAFTSWLATLAFSARLIGGRHWRASRARPRVAVPARLHRGVLRGAVACRRGRRSAGDRRRLATQRTRRGRRLCARADAGWSRGNRRRGAARVERNSM